MSYPIQYLAGSGVGYHILSTLTLWVITSLKKRICFHKLHQSYCSKDQCECYSAQH